MEYTKSEIWELRSKIDDNLAILEHYTNIFIPNPQMGLAELCLADNAVMELDAHLKHIKKYCIDKDKYDLAVEIVKKVKPVWEKYLKKVTDQKERERLGVMPGHSHFTNIMDTLLNWLDWLNKHEAVPPRSIAEGFFKAFTTVSHDCIMSIGFKYRTRIEKPKLPGIIVQEFDAYRRSKPDCATLKQVIENQLNTCKTLSETEQYICSLLLPFKEICEVLRPSTPNNESKLFIKLLCTSAINHEKELPGTVEYCLRVMLNDMNDYAIMLYNVLIQNSVDLNEYQQKTGVYFRKEWNPTNGMFFNIGDWDLIEHLSLEDKDEQIDEEKKTASFQPLSEELGKCLDGFQTSLFDEKIIEAMPYNEFVSSIYDADFSKMYKMATESRNKKRLFLIINRIKTWFPPEWETQAAISMGIEVKKMRNVTLKDIKKAHPKWFRNLDETFPKYNSTQ